MRRLALLVVAGCGRIAFDPIGKPLADDATPPIPDLVAWFPMDTVAAGITPDASGHGRDARCDETLAQCPTAVAGPRDGALQFDGVDDLFTVAPDPAFQPGTFTIALWLRVDSIDSVAYRCAVNKAIGAANGNAWQICVTNTRQVSFDSMTGGLLGMQIAIGSWHHVAIAWDGAMKSIWLDGIEENHVATTLDVDTSPVTIGEDLDAGAPAGRFPGAMDDVRIYNRVLAAAEIAALAAP